MAYDFSEGYQLTCCPERDAHTIRFHCFDTHNEITVYGCPQAPDILRSLQRSCLDYHRLWSFTMPHSDVTRLNGNASRVPVAPETAELLMCMQRFYEQEPTFDFTIGAASYLWKRARSLPSPASVSAAVSHVNADALHIEGMVVHKDDAELSVDVGAAAKGFVADRLAQSLRAQGVRCADIDLGGNLYLLGAHPQGRFWVLEIDLPDEPRYPRVLFEAKDCSVVTSSCLERPLIIEGQRFCHTIDPQTGYPAQTDIISATVLADSSVYADMLSTCVLLASSEGFEALAARHSAAQVIAITEAGEVLAAGGIEPLVSSQ